MKLQVALGQRSYDIEIQRGLLADIGQRLRDLAVGSQVLIVTDDNVGPLYGTGVSESLQQAGFIVRTITIPAGEESKSWAMAECILTELLTQQFHRDCTIMALGGGVVGDLAGFAASVYQRGVHFVQVPTSLLAQVDSSVGGKVAVNHALGKNMIGAFYQPQAVWIDLECLQTLKERHWHNGLAEVIKYGVIADQAFFDFLVANSKAILQREDQPLMEMIARCCQIKAEIVARDEQEKGERAKLNFGHTIGHGLERATHYTGYLHGEAVALGMLLATEYAVSQKRCSAAVKEQLQAILACYQLPTVLAKGIELTAVLEGMALDKKIVRDQWVFILPDRIGHVEIVQGISRTDIQRLLEGQVQR